MIDLCKDGDEKKKDFFYGTEKSCSPEYKFSDVASNGQMDFGLF